MLERWTVWKSVISAGYVCVGGGGGDFIDHFAVVTDEVEIIEDLFQIVTKDKPARRDLPCIYKGPLSVGQLFEVKNALFCLQSLFFQSKLIQCQLVEELGDGEFQIRENKSYFFSEHDIKVRHENLENQITRYSQQYC